MKSVASSLACAVALQADFRWEWLDSLAFGRTAASIGYTGAQISQFISLPFGRVALWPVCTTLVRLAISALPSPTPFAAIQTPMLSPVEF